MLGIDLGETETVTVLGREWTVGLVPAGKLAELDAAERRAVKPLAPFAPKPGRPADERTPEESEALTAAWEEARPALLAVWCELVRWGLRSAPGSVRVETEPATYAGQSYSVAHRAIVERLAHVDDGLLIRDLAAAVRRVNTLSADDVLGFAPPRA